MTVMKMTSSSIEKSRFILKNIVSGEFSINNLSVSQIQKLPMIIRINGAAIAVEYLLGKDDFKVKNIGKFCIKYIFHYSCIKIDEKVKVLKEIKADKYMCLQKDLYEFSLILKKLSLVFEKSKEETVS